MFELFLRALSQSIDSANEKLSRTVSMLTFIMGVTMLSIVVLRYGFNLGWIGLQESVIYFHAAVFLLGCAYTCRLDEHVRVDVFYRQFSLRTKQWVNLMGALLLMLPTSLFILFISWDYVIESWKLLERSKEAGGLPMVYILKSLIIVFSATLALQAISEVIKGVLALRCNNLLIPNDNSRAISRRSTETNVDSVK